MPTPLFGNWILDPSLSVFAPPRPDARMEYWSLACPCGGRVMRVSGRPRATRGSGSYFWRSVARVWREARAPTEAGEPVESPFLVPLWLECEQCGLESPILDCGEEARAGAGAGEMPERRERPQPREAFRCRACRRGGVNLVVGVDPVGGVDAAQGAATRAPLAAEVLVRCRACGHDGRIAWFDDRPTAQQVRLDLLYGRR